MGRRREKGRITGEEAKEGRVNGYIEGNKGRVKKNEKGRKNKERRGKKRMKKEKKVYEQ